MNNYFHRKDGFSDYQTNMLKNLSRGGVNPGKGKHYWYNPNATVSGNGASPSNAFQTLAEAIAACESNRGDTIHMLPGSENVTSAVAWNKAGITLIACDYGGGWPDAAERFGIYAAASYTDGPVIEVTSGPFAIIGVEIWGRNATGGSLELDGEGGGFRAGFGLIEGCRFPQWGTAAYGIEAGAGAHNVIRHCAFDGAFDAGVQFGSTVSNNPDRNTVENNYFRDCTKGIEHKAGATPHDFVYRGNTFIACGTCIDTNSNAGDGIVGPGNSYDYTVCAIADSPGSNVEWRDGFGDSVKTLTDTIQVDIDQADWTTQQTYLTFTPKTPARNIMIALDLDLDTTGFDDLAGVGHTIDLSLGVEFSGEIKRIQDFPQVTKGDVRGALFQVNSLGAGVPLKVVGILSAENAADYDIPVVILYESADTAGLTVAELTV